MPQSRFIVTATIFIRYLSRMRRDPAVLETFGGLLLAAGTLHAPRRLSALRGNGVRVLHRPRADGLLAVLNMGTPAILFCFLWLYISSAGPGPLSLDAAWSGRGR
jgi:putative oxidoreductase